MLSRRAWRTIWRTTLLIHLCRLILRPLPRSLRDYFEVGKTLGRGACGRVSRCTSVLNGQEYAVKEGLAHNPEDYTGRHGLLNELQIMQQLCLCPCALCLCCEQSCALWEACSVRLGAQPRGLHWAPRPAERAADHAAAVPQPLCPGL